MENRLPRVEVTLINELLAKRFALTNELRDKKNNVLKSGDLINREAVMSYNRDSRQMKCSFTNMKLMKKANADKNSTVDLVAEEKYALLVIMRLRYDDFDMDVTVSKAAAT